MYQYKLTIWPMSLLLLFGLWSCPPKPNVNSCQCPLLSSENIVLLDSAEIEDITTNSSRNYLDSGQTLKLNVELEKQNLKDLKAKGTLILPLDVWGGKRFFRQVKVFSSANSSDQYLEYSRWYCAKYLALIDPQNCLSPRVGLEKLFNEFQKENFQQINERFGFKKNDNPSPGANDKSNTRLEPVTTEPVEPPPSAKPPKIYEVQIQYPIPSDQIEAIEINPKPLMQDKGLTSLFVKVDNSSLTYHLSIRSLQDEWYSLDFSYDTPLKLKNHFTKNR